MIRKRSLVLFCIAWLGGISLAVPRDMPTTITKTPLGEKLDHYVGRLSEYGFSGSVLVAKGGQIILEKGYGLADVENRISVSPETGIDVGSISKQFTAAAVVKLETEGKLSTSDRISKYLKDVPSDKSEITIQQLLTNTSGLVIAIGI
jgi:CubicO group peptidase (beta-lactamase class C family)